MSETNTRSKNTSDARTQIFQNFEHFFDPSTGSNLFCTAAVAVSKQKSREALWELHDIGERYLVGRVEIVYLFF